MNLDWKAFCLRYGIDFVEQGPNVGKGNINIQCPFCDDPTHHMGLKITPQAPFFGCWRCRAAGAHPYRLLVALVGVAAAKQTLAEAENSLTQVVPDAFDSLLTKKDPVAERILRQEKPMPKVFLRLGPELSALGLVGMNKYARPYGLYLNDRGFYGKHMRMMVATTDLRFALVGEQAKRIILPVYYEGRLVSWVGRAIYKTSTLRYKAEGPDLKLTLGGYDNAKAVVNKHKAILVVTEGPFDYLKLEYLSMRRVVPVCTFGTAFTEEQFALLARLAKEFLLVAVVFDRDARLQALRLTDSLNEALGNKANVVQMNLPEGVDDPGTLDRGSSQVFYHQLRSVVLHKTGEDFTEM